MQSYPHEMQSPKCLANGHYCDLADLKPSDVPSPATIAAVLSKICRFGGHTKRFYSVAQHSVLVASLLPPEFAFEGLMHDAHEAIIGDITTPMKRVAPGLAVIDERSEDVLRSTFGLSLRLHPEVKRADLIALVIEAAHLMPTKRDWPEFAGISTELIEAHRASFDVELLPADAERLWLDKFYSLTA